MTDKLVIRVGTHFFEVRPGTSKRYMDIIMTFVRRYIKVDVQGQERKITTYAAANVARTWFRFHANTFVEFDKLLMQLGVKKEEVDVTYLPEPTVPKCEIKIADGWTVRDHQIPVIDYITKPVGKRDGVTGKWVDGGPRARMVGIGTGRGKAFPLDEVVQTPTGPIKNRDLTIGTVVFAWNGEHAAVTSINPVGKQRVYKVKLIDGRTPVVCKDHLWDVYVNQDHTSKTVTTEEMQTLINSGNSVRIDRHYVIDDNLEREFRALINGKAINNPSGDFPDYFYELRGTEEEAAKWQQMAWRCGYTARLVPLREGKAFVMVVPTGDEFDRSTISVTRVDAMPQEVEMQCIEIDHPSKLFVFSDWIVTHNTFSALKAITELGYKFVLIAAPDFVDKWAGTKAEIGDISKTTNIKQSEILVVKGGKAMRALTEMAVTPGSMDPYKAVCISQDTFSNYLKAYQDADLDMEGLGYFAIPDELWVKLGIGIRLVDEVHMKFHLNYRIDLYTHIMQSISLSATLRSRDPVQNKLYNTAYPKDERYEEGAVDKHIDSFAVLYTIPPNWQYKTTQRGSSNYNHIAYETSIMRSKIFTKAYVDLHAHILRNGFKANYKEGHKAIIFAASVDMCTLLTRELGSKFPEYTIKKYTAEDDLNENYMKPDIRVTTIGSGGTGHDIKGLTDNIMGTAIDEIKANDQAIGRLRPIEGVQTRFYFLNCSDISKHMNYLMRKKDLLREKAKSYTVVNYGMLGDHYSHIR